MLFQVILLDLLTTVVPYLKLEFKKKHGVDLISIMDSYDDIDIDCLIDEIESRFDNSDESHCHCGAELISTGGDILCESCGKVSSVVNISNEDDSRVPEKTRFSNTTGTDILGSRTYTLIHKKLTTVCKSNKIVQELTTAYRTANINITQCVIDKAISIFKKASEGVTYRGKKRSSLIAASLYYAYMILQYYTSKDYIEKLMKCSITDGSHIIQNRNIIKTEEYITPENSITFYGNTLGLSFEEIAFVIEKYKKTKFKRNTSTIKSIAIAFIYMTYPDKIKEIVSKCNISETTLVKIKSKLIT